jgi:hypothetical protein
MRNNPLENVDTLILVFNLFLNLNSNSNGAMACPQLSNFSLVSSFWHKTIHNVWLKTWVKYQWFDWRHRSAVHALKTLIERISFTKGCHVRNSDLAMLPAVREVHMDGFIPTDMSAWNISKLSIDKSMYLGLTPRFPLCLTFLHIAGVYWSQELDLRIFTKLTTLCLLDFSVCPAAFYFPPHLSKLQIVHTGKEVFFPLHQIQDSIQSLFMDASCFLSHQLCPFLHLRKLTLLYRVEDDRNLAFLTWQHFPRLEKLTLCCYDFTDSKLLVISAPIRKFIILSPRSSIIFVPHFPFLKELIIRGISDELHFSSPLPCLERMELHEISLMNVDASEWDHHIPQSCIMDLDSILIETKEDGSLPFVLLPFKNKINYKNIFLE